MTVRPLAIVTGGKRRLGAAIAAKLAGAGYALALVSHVDTPPEPVLAAALEANGSEWHAFTFDLSAGDPAKLEAHFRLNLFAPLLLSQALVQAAGPAARPAIVNILDQRVVNPHRDQISYTLSKQALAMSVRSMAASFAGRARYNGVAPGLVIATDDYTAEQETRLADMMPLGALPSPSAVADAVVYLAQAQDVTGQVIFVDGGAHLKSFDRDFMHL